ncbi:MAG: hypothetical protein KC613_23415 [Myxococcales bacterium]|nr:hypothetical protein [Myxococcales bacterium]MCB9523751.1 hypothetical protein [Myxococcales bacterium]
MNPLWWVLFTALNVPILLMVGRWLFEDLAGFLEAVKYTLMPDIVSMLRGEWQRDWEQSMRMALWLAVGGGLYFGEYLLVAG